MRENMKDKILQCFQSIYDAHTYIEQLVQNENYEQAKILLVDCQNVAVQIGATIEKYEESNTSVVPLLEQYCEEVYKGYSNISEIGNLRTLLSQTLTKAEKRVESDSNHVAPGCISLRQRRTPPVDAGNPADSWSSNQVCSG